MNRNEQSMTGSPTPNSTPNSTPKPAATPVAVIGLGPMGQAMARALLGAGHPVTLWNRTASRARDLVAAGATLAASPSDALRSADITVLSLTDYGAMYDILGDHTTALEGKAVVNLSSDTPDASRRAAEWAASHGATLLTGGVMVPPPMLATAEAYVYYSGPGEVLDRFGSALSVIGSPRYLGADPGLAQLYYQAHLDVFLTTLSSLLHATALVATAGVTAAEFIPEVLPTLTTTAAMIGGGDELAHALDHGEHPGDLSTVLMMGATADHIVGTSEALGVDSTLPRAVKSHYDRAIAAGHATDNWTSLYEVIKADVAAE